MINQKQIWLYWREWREVKRILMNGSGARRSPRVLGQKVEPIVTGGVDDCAFDESARRHELHLRALGHDKSHKDFNNRELDLVLGEFRAISRPADLQSQLNALDGRKARLIFGIRRTAQKLRVSDKYIEGVIEQMTDRSAKLDQLNEDELENVRIALAKQVVRENKREVAA
jgi:hypothetical protein